MLANGCFPNIVTATPPLSRWHHRTITIASLETPPAHHHIHLRCAAATQPLPDHLLSSSSSRSDSDSDSDWSISPNPNPKSPVTNNNRSVNSGSKGLTAGFTRLKAKRVKAIVKRIKPEQIITPAAAAADDDDDDDDDDRVSRERSFPKNVEEEGSFADSNFRGRAIGGSIRNPKFKSHVPHFVKKRLSQSAGDDNDEDYEDGRGVSMGGSFRKNGEHEGSFAASNFRGRVDGGCIRNPNFKSKSPHFPKKLYSLSAGDDIGEDDDDRGVPRGGSSPKNDEAEASFAASNFRGWADGGRNPNLKSYSPHHLSKHLSQCDFFSRKTFSSLGCSEYMVKSLKQQLFPRPSHIQAKAFGPVIEGHSCIIADQSGSGKTLAYLIPIVQRLREEELQGVSNSSSGSPRAVVIVPTAELASQVLSCCRSLSKSGVPFRSMVVTGGFRQKTQLENLEQGVDVLIATPGRFMFLIKEGFLQLANLRSAVFDEVDILFNDEDFKVALQSLIDSAPVITQYLFVTATLPVEIYNRLIEFFPDTKVIMGPGMHHISSGLEEVLIDCSGGEDDLRTPDTAFDNKKTALLKLVEDRPVSKTIIFCNKIETCRKVENILKRSDRKETTVRVLPFHAALAQEARTMNMKEFNRSQPGGESLILICTDRASRGIDFAGVDHVVLFDFPREPSEYVRRVGRTARGAGGKGKAFIFVVGKQVPLARKIIERNQKGHPLHEVPAAF